jgi:hypothetical protein
VPRCGSPDHPERISPPSVGSAIDARAAEVVDDGKDDTVLLGIRWTS